MRIRIFLTTFIVGLTLMLITNVSAQQPNEKLNRSKDVFSPQNSSTQSLTIDATTCANVIKPGQSSIDFASDVSAEHVDFTEVNSSLSGESLTAILKMKDVPPTLTFNRPDLGSWHVEYNWSVGIDIDNNSQTGNLRDGLEYELYARAVVWDPPGATINKPIENGVNFIGVCKYTDGSNTCTTIASGVFSVNANANILTLSGDIPGITTNSRLIFIAYDYDGNVDIEDKLLCRISPVLEINHTEGRPDSYFTLTGSGYPANSSAAIIVNGNTVGTVQTDANGAFVIELNTGVADVGAYFVTITANFGTLRIAAENIATSAGIGATTKFTLDSSSPNTWPSEGVGTSFNVPAGIAFTEFIYLPLIQR